MKKEFITFFLFFFIFQNSVSQKKYNLSGKLVDGKNNAVANANIIFRETSTSNIISYSASTVDGKYTTFFTTNSTSISVTFSCLGYKSLNRIVTLENLDIDLENSVLVEDATELSEVIIAAEKSGITKNGDTTIYNVKKFLNGTEDSLKDLLSNLPGMKINNNGKIEVNGNVISELLIDGENLYKNQHQFATENLSSKIVKSIEYYKNYTPYDKIKKDSITNDTALNIIIKEEYKNKFKGYLLVENNLKERYKVSSNAYHFSKKNKFSIIQSSNNLGELPITTIDYFSLIDNDEIKTESSVQLKSFESIPKFFRSGENVAKKDNSFVNISNVYTPNKKVKINFFSILNYASQLEISNREIQYNNAELNIIENANTSEKSFFNLTNLKAVYKTNPKTIYKINSYLTIDNLVRYNNLNSIINDENSTVNQNAKNKNYQLSNKFDFSKKFSESDISASVLFKNEKSTNNTAILSSDPFLNLNFTGDFIFIQDVEKIKNDIEVESKYAFKLFNANHSFKLRYGNFFRDFKNFSPTNSNYSNIYYANEDVLSQEFNSALSLNKKIKVSIAINNNSNFQSTNSTNLNRINFLGYNFNFDYFFNQNSILRFNNSFSRKLTTPENIFQKEYILDYRTIIKNFNLQPNSLFPVNKISVNYLLTNTENENFFIANLDHTWKRKYEGINQISEDNFIILENTVASKNNYTSFFIYTENKFKNRPLSITFNFDFNSGYQRFFVNYLESFFKSNYYSSSISLKSNFKKSVVHFNTGFSFSYSDFNNDNIKNNSKTFQTFATLNGLFLKNFNWKLKYSFNKFMVENENNLINILSASLRYSPFKSNWDFSINAHNVFNFSNAVFVSNQTGVGLQSILRNQNLAGYINFGLKYKL